MNYKLQNRIPQIRFPEFQGKWVFMRGDEIFKSISNKNHNSDLPILAITQDFGAIPRELINYQIKVTKKSISSYKVVEVGDFIISLRSFQGGIEYSKYKGICSPAYIILKPYIEIERGFFKYHFKTFRYIQQLKSKLEGIRDGKMVSYKYFSEIKLPFPTLPEQKRIANFFTILDNKINQLKEKKALLEEYKKGMMQKIFSQEVRFKPAYDKSSAGRDDYGNDYPEWEEKKLGKILKIGSGKDYKHLEDGNIPVYGSGGYMTSVNKYIFDGESVCIGRKGTIDKPVYLNEKFWTVDTLFYTYDFINSVPKFIFYLFLKINWKRHNEASGVPSLSKKTIESVSIYLPTQPEQTKIANFLSKIDDKIKTVNEQIEETKKYKKGLLQMMYVN